MSFLEESYKPTLGSFNSVAKGKVFKLYKSSTITFGIKLLRVYLFGLIF